MDHVSMNFSPLDNLGLGAAEVLSGLVDTPSLFTGNRVGAVEEWLDCWQEEVSI
jgi:hypothetical protein